MTEINKEVLEQFMLQLGFNRDEMARYLGVPKFTFYKWLSGERTMDSAVKSLVNLLMALHTHSQVKVYTFLSEYERGRMGDD